MKLRCTQRESTNDNFDQKEFVKHKEIAAADDVTDTPDYSSDKIPGKKPMLPLPWAVINENDE